MAVPIVRATEPCPLGLRETLTAQCHATCGVLTRLPAKLAKEGSAQKDAADCIIFRYGLLYFRFVFLMVNVLIRIMNLYPWNNKWNKIKFASTNLTFFKINLVVDIVCYIAGLETKNRHIRVAVFDGEKVRRKSWVFMGIIAGRNGGKHWSRGQGGICPGRKMYI